MCKITLKCGKEVLVDKEEYEFLSRFTWFNNGKGYALASINGEVVRMHRLITNCGTNFEVDHINGNTLDNRKSNLRVCSHKENSRNVKIPSHNTTGYKGVSFNKKRNKYRAYIKYEQKQIHLGYFLDKKEAALAYNKKAVELFGDFFKLNEVE